MAGILPVIHEEAPPFELPGRAITLIEGRRLEPLGTYSTMNLVFVISDMIILKKLCKIFGYAPVMA